MAPAKKKKQSKGGQKTAQAKVPFLPTEIIATILALLDFRDILRCQLVSKQFDRLVREDVQLQYIIELALANLVDGRADNNLTTGERLKLLKESQEAWKEYDLKLKRKVEVPDHARCTHWAFCGGVLMLAHLDVNTEPVEDFECFDNLEICSIRSGGALNFRNHYFEQGVFTDFVLDASQDLIVLWDRSTAEEDGLPVSFYTISTCTPHDRAKQPTVLFPFCDSEQKELVQIHDDLIAVLGSSSSKVTVMNWTTGAKRSLSGTFSGACLVSNRCLVVTKMHAVSIDVYTIKQSKKHGLTLTLVAHFGLPTLREDMLCAISCQLFGCGNTRKTSALDDSVGPPFSTSPAPTMMLLNMKIDDDTDYWQAGEYFVFSQLVPFLSALDELSPRKRKPTTICWENWGPDSTWWFDKEVGSNWEYKQSRWKDAMYGYRIMLPDVILDFNVRDIEHSLAEVSPESDEDSDEPEEHAYDETDHTVVERGTVAPNWDRYFAKKVSTRAPYRKTSLSESWLIESYHFYMLNEEVIGVEMDGDDKYPCEFFVYSTYGSPEVYHRPGRCF